MGENNPGRPPAITASDIYDLLIEVREPLSVTEIADEFGVAPDTVRKRVDDVSSYRQIESKKMGKSSIYWHRERRWGDEYEPVELDVDLETAAADYREFAYKKLLAARAEWLDARQRTRESCGRTAEPTEESVSLRLNLLSDLADYENTVATQAPPGYDEVRLLFEDEEPPETVRYEEDKHALDKDTFEYFVLEIPLFSGTVEGIPTIGKKNVLINRQLEEASEDGMSVAVMDDVVPNLEEILHAGDALDDFMTAMWEVDW